MTARSFIPIITAANLLFFIIEYEIWIPYDFYGWKLTLFGENGI